jgi:hypothetical protein
VTYISIDVETNGPCPGINSMLQIGAAAFDEEGQLLEDISYNLELLKGSVADPKTMAWWLGKKDAYENTRFNIYHPQEAMGKFVAWVRKFPKPTALAYPAGFDFPWVYYYCHLLTGDCPFGFQCLDIKSYAAAILKVPYREATKKNMPHGWFVGLPKHTHDAADDAIEQGMLFFRMRKFGNYIDNSLNKTKGL